ncbi:ATP12 [Mytilus edulis]|uniref:ATP synthase mitochondrial F1 complex assembly factor 2 n=2 Tax=Mytilus TaxID=6548 RepID=A0A8B6DKB7_MYTGA|nr:ATP12 [Mytilus edulis]VDI19912.1 ATP synthase mitochondrial F1 complex assembly factor 2 [Mytilus galloprovincialis]
MAAPMRIYHSAVKSFLNVSNSHCTCSVRRFNPRELKKFYKNATITQTNGWFEINLDQKKLKTPNGKVFKVPNEALALAVATEWNMQHKIVKRHYMHLTSLCNTALDNPTYKSREDLVRSALHYAETDTLCYRLEEPEDLAKLEKVCWDPILEWARKRYDIEIESTTGLLPPEVPSSTYNKLRRHLLSYGDWALFGFLYGTENLKSLILMLAVVDKHIDVKTAVTLSRLEQNYQTTKWGNVEWYHDLDIEELHTRVAAAALFIYWSSESSSIIEKAVIEF